MTRTAFAQSQKLTRSSFLHRRLSWDAKIFQESKNPSGGRNPAAAAQRIITGSIRQLRGHPSQEVYEMRRPQPCLVVRGRKAGLRTGHGSSGKAILHLTQFMIFCCTILPLASTRWVCSRFSSHCSLSSKQLCWLTSATLKFFPSQIVSGAMGIKPRVAGSGRKY